MELGIFSDFFSFPLLLPFLQILFFDSRLVCDFFIVLTAADIAAGSFENEFSHSHPLHDFTSSSSSPCPVSDFILYMTTFADVRVESRDSRQNMLNLVQSTRIFYLFTFLCSASPSISPARLHAKEIYEFFINSISNFLSVFHIKKGCEQKLFNELISNASRRKNEIVK